MWIVPNRPPAQFWELSRAVDNFSRWSNSQTPKWFYHVNMRNITIISFETYYSILRTCWMCVFYIFVYLLQLQNNRQSRRNSKALTVDPHRRKIPLPRTHRTTPVLFKLFSSNVVVGIMFIVHASGADTKTLGTTQMTWARRKSSAKYVKLSERENPILIMFNQSVQLNLDGQVQTFDGNVTSGEEEEEEDTLYRIRYAIRNFEVYFVPVIIAVGLVGNVLSFLVFTYTYLRRLPSSIYMAALAIADTVFLFILFLSWICNFNILLYHRNVFCQLFTYINSVASFLSVWYVVCCTVERHLIVCSPLQRQILCSRRRARIVVVSLAVTGLAVYNYILWTCGLVELPQEVGQLPEYICNVKEQYYTLVVSINNVDTLVTLIVPASIIIISNVRISCSLSEFYRERDRSIRRECRELNPTAGRSTAASRMRMSVSSPSYNRLQMRVTKMLLIVSTVFLVCNSPSHAVRVYVFVMELIDNEYQPTKLLVAVQSITLVVYYAGFSTNFILYNISGKTFRRTLCRLCRCLARRLTTCICVRLRNLKSKSNSYPETRVMRFLIKYRDPNAIT